MVAERSVLSDTRIIHSFVLCLVLHPISGFCFGVLFLSSRKYMENLIFGAFFFLGCISLLPKAYEGDFPEFRVLMMSAKQNAELPAVDREMVSTCITAQMLKGVLASWSSYPSYSEGGCKVTMGWVALCHQDFSPPFAACQRHWPPTRGNSFSTGLAAVLVFPQPSIWLTFYRKNALKLHSSPWVVYSACAWLLLLVCGSLKNKIVSS